MHQCTVPLIAYSHVVLMIMLLIKCTDFTWVRVKIMLLALHSLLFGFGVLIVRSAGLFVHITGTADKEDT